MDQFYAENAQLYRKLVNAVDPSKPAPHFSRFTAKARSSEVLIQQYSPDIIVSARIRPMLEEDLVAGFPCAAYPRTCGLDATERQIVDLHDLYHSPRGLPVLKSTKHEVDKLFGANASTEEIYSSIMPDLIASVKQGGIGTLFAYGQTGSGKTFTISLLQQLTALDLLFDCQANQRIMYMTVFDLAGNAASDLLNTRNPIAILEDATGKTQLAGVTEHQLHSQGQVLELLEQAAAVRRTASTLKNDASSRSHAVCRLRISDGGGTDQDGYLYMVDLAGSEAARDRVTHGADRMRETREINLSLSVLKECIRAKVELESRQCAAAGSKGKKVHMPFRQSTLTKVLKHIFDPESSSSTKTAVIACVNPSLADVGPSKNTLRYAEMLRVPIANVG